MYMYMCGLRTKPHLLERLTLSTIFSTKPSLKPGQDVSIDLNASMRCSTERPELL